MRQLQSYRMFGLALLVGVASVLMVTLHTGQASAQSETAKAIKVSPVRSELTIEAGKSAKVSTFVTNTTKAAVNYKIIENDFVAGDDEGTPSLILDENSYAPTHSLKRFMLPVSGVTVAPGATQQVDITITVPKSAQAGGYFGAVRFVAGANAGSMVNFDASATSLILMTVPGDLVENLSLTNFEVRQNGNAAGNFRNADKLDLLVKFENTGNVQVAPYGKVSVTKGDKVVYSSDFNGGDPRGNVLPDSSRKWTVPLNNIGKFGKYTVHATFSYGTKNKTLDITKTIWIVPTMYIIGAIAALAVIFLILGLLVMLIRAKRANRSRGFRRR